MYKQKDKPQFYIITGFIDFRCGIDLLCSLLKGITNINSISNSAFIFMNKIKEERINLLLPKCNELFSYIQEQYDKCLTKSSI